MKDKNTFLLFPQVEISQESVWIDFNIHTNAYDLWKRKEEAIQLSKFEMNSSLQRSEWKFYYSFLRVVEL